MTTFTAWTDDLTKAQYSEDSGKTAANALPKTANFYYLTQDVTLDATWEPAGNTMLCLNGHSITGKNGAAVITVGDGVHLTLCDCNRDQKTYRFGKGGGTPWILDASGDYEVSGGIVAHAKNQYGSGVLVDGTGIFDMYGGTLVGNSGTSAGSGSSNGSNGGGVYVKGAGSTFNLYAGAITGNTVSGEDASYGGGGVYVSGNFNMYGGAITNNALARFTSGGGVHVSRDGTFNMTGGVIGGEGEESANQGGVVVRRGTFNMNGSAKITHNEKFGVHVFGGAFNMGDNAVIAGNSGFGVEVAVYTASLDRVDGAFTMKGSASITGNTGGGVKVGTKDGKISCDTNL